MALDPVEGAALANLAAHTIAARLTGRQPPTPVPAAASLVAHGASFVTLEALGRLRGCVGTVEPARPLYLDVVRNAGRAMRDPRTVPVTVDEWDDLEVKVSVLGLPQPVAAGSRDELLTALRPGVDGLLLFDRQRRATFLPSVWDKLPEPTLFLAALLTKGGWAPDEWPPGLTASRYTSAEYRAPRPLGTLPG